MDFQATGLPELQICRHAFELGYDRVEDLQTAVSMAQMIMEHGGACHSMAAAACLAGPALFSRIPDARLDAKLLTLGQEILDVNETGAVHDLSPDARIFLQVCAIFMLEQEAAAEPPVSIMQEETYLHALQLYSRARGENDTFHLDARCEVAAMKLTSVMKDKSRLWARLSCPTAL
ncbi:MAG: hypothetical protein OXT65_04720 [Alphaproteobacteria bacterium]|nr:hypothetical protein [Alphaproteobacteria bacterium]